MHSMLNFRGEKWGEERFWGCGRKWEGKGGEGGEGREGEEWNGRR